MSERTSIVYLAFDLTCQSLGGGYLRCRIGGGEGVLCISGLSNKVHCIEMKCEE